MLVFLKIMFFIGCYVLLFFFSSHVTIVDLIVVILLIDKCID